MDTTRGEFILKMRRLIEAAENRSYTTEVFQDCMISAGGYGGSVEFSLGKIKAEAQLYRTPLDDVEERVKEPAGRRPVQKVEFNRITENLIEIVWAFDQFSIEHPESAEIDSMEWKQHFIKWANEFEEINHNREWSPEDGNDYYEAIEEFVKLRAAGVEADAEVWQVKEFSAENGSEEDAKEETR